MRYYEIEAKMDSTEGMIELLESLQENHFNCIDYHIGLFRSSSLNEQARLQQTIDELTGVYMDLQTYYAVALSRKVNRESAHFHNTKIAAENAGVKYTVSMIDKEASYAVASDRRLVHILEGKIHACEKAISTCQSRMKLLSSEIQTIR